MERLGDHLLPRNLCQAPDLNLSAGPRRPSSPSPHPRSLTPVLSSPRGRCEAGVTLTTSGTLHLTPLLPPQKEMLCPGMWASTRPQKTRAPVLLFLNGAIRGCDPAWPCREARATLILFPKTPLHSPCSPLPEGHPCQHIYPTFLPAILTPTCEWYPAPTLSAHQQRQRTD